MDYTDWLILHTLSTEKNITSTAEKLFITQPALTYRIKNLEKELHSPLLIRSHSGVYFTGQGLIATQYADEMLERYNELHNVISSMDHEVSGSVNVAVSPIIARYKMPDLLYQFQQQYPLVNIYMKTTISSSAINMLLKNVVQVAIIRGDYKLNLKTHLLSKEPITLISKNPVKLEELPNLPYIVYETDSPLEKDIINWWRESFDKPPKTIMHVNDSFTCRQLVAQGLGFSILPDIGPKHSYGFNLFIQPLKNKKGRTLIRSTSMVYKEQISKVKAVDAFIKFIIANMKKR